MRIENTEFRLFFGDDPPAYEEQIARLQIRADLPADYVPTEEFEERLLALRRQRRELVMRGTGPDPTKVYDQGTSVLAFDLSSPHKELCGYLRTVREAHSSDASGRLGGMERLVGRHTERGRRHRCMWLAQIAVTAEVAEVMEASPEAGSVADVMLSIAVLAYDTPRQPLYAYAREGGGLLQCWFESLGMHPEGLPVELVAVGEPEMQRARLWKGQSVSEVGRRAASKPGATIAALDILGEYHLPVR
jgi:hypothetical protein